MGNANGLEEEDEEKDMKMELCWFVLQVFTLENVA